MASLNEQQKEEIKARIAAFSFSGFKAKLSSDICRYVGSLVGRDFKAVAQVAPFILAPYMKENEKKVWLSLSKVNYSTKKNKKKMSFKCTCIHFCAGVQNGIL